MEPRRHHEIQTWQVGQLNEFNLKKHGGSDGGGEYVLALLLLPSGLWTRDSATLALSFNLSIFRGEKEVKPPQMEEEVKEDNEDDEVKQQLVNVCSLSVCFA